MIQKYHNMNNKYHKIYQHKYHRIRHNHTYLLTIIFNNRMRKLRTIRKYYIIKKIKFKLNQEINI